MSASNPISIRSFPINSGYRREELRISNAPFLGMLTGCALSLPLWVLIILAFRTICF